MDINELINSALNKDGHLIGGDNLFVLEGNIERNEFRVVTADECLKTNLITFAYAIQHGFVSLGTYTSRTAAEDQIPLIRSYFRDEEGRCLL